MKKFGDILLVMGGGVLFLIPLIHFIRLGGIKVSGDPILWLFGGTCMLFIGLIARVNNEQTARSLGYKIVDCYKITAILILNSLILFASLELAAMGYVKIRSLFSRPTEQLVGEGTPREKSSYYASKNWSAQYWHEFRLSRKTTYHPYIVWRRAPFKGTTINIDQRGIRLTPSANCTADAFKVFTFGGSTMWGTGSPDSGTIPAYLQAGLEKVRDRPICVVNFGETAYVSTQSVVELLLQVQSGNVPNWVIFYDGPNDIYVGYQSGRSDVHENFDRVAARIEKREEVPKSGAFMELLKSAHLFSLSVNLVSKLNRKPQASPKLINYESMGIDAATLTESIVERYLSNYKIVDALAQEYGFEYEFFWPPYVSIGDKPLTSEEKVIRHQVDPAFDKLCHSIYRTIERVAPQYKNLYYMGKIFDGYEPLLWIDDFHVTPVGNQMIAEKMLEITTHSTLNKSSKKKECRSSSASFAAFPRHDGRG